MAIRVPSPAEAANKLARVAATRTQDYAEAVADPGVDWASATAAQKDAWQEGVNDAAQRDAFRKGVEASGNDRWRDKVTKIGAGRWAPGVAAAKDDYSEAMGPVLDTIARVNLPPRGKRGDPRNYLRSQAVGDALSQLRTGGRR